MVFLSQYSLVYWYDVLGFYVKALIKDKMSLRDGYYVTKSLLCRCVVGIILLIGIIVYNNSNTISDNDTDYNKINDTGLYLKLNN